MYRIYAEIGGHKVCIHDDTVESDEVKVLEPRLHLQDSNAGSLDFKLAPNNVAYQPITEYVESAIGVVPIGNEQDITSSLEQGGINDSGQPVSATNAIRTPNAIAIQNDATSISLPYLLSGTEIQISSEEMAQATSVAIQYPKSGHQSQEDDYIDAETFKNIIFEGTHQNEPISLTGMFEQGSISVTGSTPSLVSSAYTIRTSKISFSSPTSSRPIYLSATFSDGYSGALEWCVVYYRSDTNAGMTDWVQFTDADTRLTIPANNSIGAIRILCRYKNRAAITPEHIASATLLDYTDLYFKVFSYDENFQYIGSTGYIQNGRNMAYGFPGQKYSKIEIVFGNSGNLAISIDDIINPKIYVKTDIRASLYWYDSTSTFLSKDFTNSSTYSFAVPDNAVSFKVALSRYVEDALLPSNFSYVKYSEMKVQTVQIPYQVDPVSRMESTITVCRDTTTTTVTNDGDPVTYTTSEIEEMFTKGFINYKGELIDDEEAGVNTYTLLSDFITVTDAYRSITLDIYTVNQNDQLPDVKWAYVAYDANHNFLHCNRWFENHTRQIHEGQRYIKYVRLMLRYVEPEYAIYQDQIASLTIKQDRVITNRQETEIWEGRVLYEDVDFWNNRVLHCEGELAYLNDTLQPSRAYDGYTISLFFQSLIAVHNSKSNAAHQFVVGTVWDADNGSTDRRITQYESTLEVINKLVEDYGGHLKVHKEKVNGKTVRVIDWVENFEGGTGNQTINFGENLLDFTRNYDLSQLCTVVLPTGEVVQEAESSKAGDPVAINGGAGPTRGQLLYKNNDGTVSIQAGKNLGGYMTGVAQVTPGETYYYSGRLHGGYVAYTIKSNADGTGDYYEGGTVTAGSADQVGFVDFLDKEIKIPAGAHSVVMCSFGNDIPMTLKNQIPEVEGVDIVLTVDDISDDVEIISSGGETVRKTWHLKGSPYVSNPNTINRYGWIEKRLDLPDVTDSQTLYNAAKKYLEDGQFEEMTLEVTAIDLNSFGQLVDNFNLLDQVRVVSEPHGLDRWFPITEIDIPLDNPADQTFTLGMRHEVSLTETSSSISEKLQQQIMKAPTTSYVIREAKRNAAAAINTATKGGFINFIMNDDDHPCELVISDNPDYYASNAEVWRWNEAGLAHSSKGYDLDEFNMNVAITADGEVIANKVMGNLFEGVTINGGQITIGANATPGIENRLLVRSSSEDSSYVKLSVPSGGKPGIQFGTLAEEGNAAIGDYGSIEENYVTLDNVSKPCVRLLGNNALILDAPHLLVGKWQQGTPYQVGYNGTISYDGHSITVTNGIITNYV